MPHLLAADLASADSSALRHVACDACWYLLERGDILLALDLSHHLHQQWRDRLGDDDHEVMAAGHYLGWALQLMGRWAEARALHQDTLGPRSRGAGRGPPRHPVVRR